jgi:hypothetical protein
MSFRMSCRCCRESPFEVSGFLSVANSLLCIESIKKLNNDMNPCDRNIRALEFMRRTVIEFEEIYQPHRLVLT